MGKLSGKIAVGTGAYKRIGVSIAEALRAAITSINVRLLNPRNELEGKCIQLMAQLKR